MFGTAAYGALIGFIVGAIGGLSARRFGWVILGCILLLLAVGFAFGVFSLLGGNSAGIAMVLFIGPIFFMIVGLLPSLIGAAVSFWVGEKVIDKF